MTLLTKSWAVQRISDEFGISKHVANKACALKKEKSIPGEPANNLEKTPSEGTTKTESTLYADDKFSWMCTKKERACFS